MAIVLQQPENSLKYKIPEAFDHDESWADGLPIVTAQHFIKDHNIEHQVRLNGLPRLDPIFDQLIGHPSILPYLKEFMGDPQLVNTWSISKYEGRAEGRAALPQSLVMVA